MNKLVGIATLIAAVWVAGCKTTPEVAAYRTIGTVTVMVDGAMNGWGDYVRAGKATEEDEVAVRKYYMEYQDAMRTTKAIVYAAKGSNATGMNLALEVLQQSADRLVMTISALTK